MTRFVCALCGHVLRTEGREGEYEGQDRDGLPVFEDKDELCGVCADDKLMRERDEEEEFNG